jgi:hypothetical protein
MPRRRNPGGFSRLVPQKRLRRRKPFGLASLAPQKRLRRRKPRGFSRLVPQKRLRRRKPRGFSRLVPQKRLRRRKPGGLVRLAPQKSRDVEIILAELLCRRRSCTPPCRAPTRRRRVEGAIVGRIQRLLLRSLGRSRFTACGPSCFNHFQSGPRLGAAQTVATTVTLSSSASSGSITVPYDHRGFFRSELFNRVAHLGKLSKGKIQPGSNIDQNPAGRPQDRCRQAAGC